MGPHAWYDCVWHLKHIRNGKVIWEQEKRNALVNQGEENILRTFFRDELTPSSFYIRLCRDSLVIGDELSDIQNEPVGNGYTPFELERSAVGFPTIETDNSHYRLVTKLIQFEASGGSIGPVNTAFLATSSDNTGKLIAFTGLTVERTIADGDLITGQLKIKLQ